MNIKQNIVQVRQTITDAAQNCDRDPKEISLLAVSKTKSVDEIQIAIDCGQTLFGENYLQEGVEKIRYFQQKKLNHLQWHFIGSLQSNKTQLVAHHFDWVQTVDREKIAYRLNEQRPVNLPNLNVLIQINISQEESKSGIILTQLDELAKKIHAFPRLCLRGLMAIPAPFDVNPVLPSQFEQLKQAFMILKKRYTTVDTLSMGMSEDLIYAIQHGSTMVRIGRVIFGKRN